jgi:hypothetical protein
VNGVVQDECDRIVWINADTFFNFHSDMLHLEDHHGHYQIFLTVSVESDGLVSVFASSVEHATAACEYTKIKLDFGFELDLGDTAVLHLPVTGPALSRFLVHSRNLLHLELSGYHLNTDHCRSIATIETEVLP